MALGSLVDSPLPPLGIGGGLGGLTDEQREAFMKARGPEVAQPEVYTNPVTKKILDDFSNSDFAKNVNQMQQDVATININGLPITGNGSYIGNLTEYIRSIGKGDIISGSLLQPGGALSGIPLDPQADMPKILGDPLRPRSDDPLMQGFFDSEFYSPISTTNVVNYKFRGKDMQGSGSQASDLKKYLESIGQGNLIELSNESIAQQGSGPLATMEGQNPYTVNYGGGNVGPNVGNEIAVPSTPNPIQGIGLDGKPIGPGLQDLVSPTTPPTPTIPKLDGTVGFPVTVSGPETVATVNPYQEQFTGFSNQLTGFGDQLTGFGDQFSGLDKQFNTINTRLDNVDEGIASLSEQLQPQQQLYNSPYSNFNFRTNSYSNPSPFGLSSLFMRRY